MVQKRETKAINKLCVREILSLSFVCGAYFFEFRSRNLVCFGIAYNFDGKFAPEKGKARMRTAFFTRVSLCYSILQSSWPKRQAFMLLPFLMCSSQTTGKKNKTRILCSSLTC